MTVLLTFECQDGKSRSCNSRCYNAKTHACQCICRGANHGQGFQAAIRETHAHAPEWLAAWNLDSPANRVLYALNDYSETIAQLTLFPLHSHG